MRSIDRLVLAPGVLAAVNAACNGFVGEAFVNRRATLTVRVETADAAVPCTATSLLFGEEEERVEVGSGGVATPSVGMLTPLKTPAPVRARLAVRVECKGYRPITTSEREVELSATAPPTVDFGTLALAADAP